MLRYFIIMKVFEFCVKVYGEGEYLRVGKFSVMSVRGLSCSKVKDRVFFFL